MRAVDPKTHVIRTVVGTGTAGFSGDGGPADRARLGGTGKDPLYQLGGMAVGPDGTLYIADAGSHRVRAYDPDKGTISTVAGSGSNDDRHFGGDGGPATRAKLYYPRDVAVGADGTLYIADTLNYRVRAVNPKTKRIRTVAGVANAGDSGSGFFPRPSDDSSTATKRFVEPDAVAVGGDGRVYLAETRQDRVLGVDPAKNTVTDVVGRGSASSYLKEPTDLAVRGDTLYVTGTDVYAGGENDGRVFGFDLKRHRLSVVAGGSDPDGVGDGGKPTAAQLGEELSVAVSATGDVYIADFTTNRVRVVRKGDPNARRTANRLAGKPITTLLGSGRKWTERSSQQRYEEEQGTFYRDVHGRRDVDLNSPESVAVDDDGTVYVADTANQRIRVLEPGDDEVRTLAGRPDLPDSDVEDGDAGKATKAFLHAPTGLTLGPHHRLYFVDVDYQNERVRYVDLRKGTIDTVRGSKNELDSASDLAFDRSGRLYIADSDHGRVCRMRLTDDECTTVVGETRDGQNTGPFNPQSIVVGPDGTLYVADFATATVRAYDLAKGTERTVAGIYASAGMSGDGSPGTSAQIAAPAGLALGRDGGTLYLADRGNHRVRAVDLETGVITTVAGTGRATEASGAGVSLRGGGFAGDGGRAGKAKLAAPYDVAAGPNGELYVADTGNERIRVIGDVDLSTRHGANPLAAVVPPLQVVAAAVLALWLLRRGRRGPISDV